MKIKMLFKSKNFLQRLTFSFSICILLIVVVLSSIFYIETRQLFINTEYNTSKKILYQIKFNIGFVDNSIKNICSYLYLNHDLSSIMNYTGNNSDIYLTLNNAVNPILLANNYIHSICVYNSYNNQYFYSGKPLSFDDKQLKNIISEYPGTPRLKPIFRTIDTSIGKKTSYEYVITYIMYETAGSPKKLDSAVIINIRPDWILDNIKMISLEEKDKAGSVFLMNEKGEFFERINSNSDMENLLYSVYMKNMKNDKKKEGFFECKLNGKQLVVTFAKIDTIGLTLFKVQSASEVYKPVDNLKTIIIIISLVFMFLSLYITVILSYRLYNPLGKLINNISSASNSKMAYCKGKDEISYLSYVYNNSIDTISRYENDRLKQITITKAYWLKKFLIGCNKMGEEMYNDICRNNSINLPCDKNYIVCVLEIDDLSKFLKSTDINNRELIKLDIIKFSTGLLSETFRTEGVDINENRIALIICIENEYFNYLSDIVLLMEKIQGYLMQKFSISVTVSVSEMSGSIYSIAENYNKASSNLKYKYLLGKMSIITQTSVGSYTNEHYAYSKKLEEELVESIKCHNTENMIKSLKLIFNEISRFSYENSQNAAIQLADKIKHTIDSVVNSHNPRYYDFINMKRMVYELETIDDLCQLMITLLIDIFRCIPENKYESKYKIVAEKVSEIINKNYSDITLCPNKIASMMKMNTRQLTRIFQECTGISISGCIKNTRLEKAAQLLEQKYSVYEVIDNVGFEYESYFYKMFKEKYGHTPKEYMLLKKTEI